MISLSVDLLVNTAKSSSTSAQPISDLELIERAMIDVSEMLDRVLAYVRDVLSGQKKGDPAVGRYLMDTLGASTEGLEKGGFNSSLQVEFNYQLYLCFTNGFSLSGYTDGFIPCKPCEIASGSVVSTRPCCCHMIRLVAILVATHDRLFLSTIEDTRVLQVMTSCQNFAERPCVRRTVRCLIEFVVGVVENASTQIATSGGFGDN
jgi:hypothetical protein